MAQKSRLLLLVSHLGSGGAEQVIARLARGLSHEKYEVYLGVITQKESSTESMPPWVTVHPLGASRVRTGALRMLRLVRRLKPDLILSGTAHLNFLVLLLRPFFPRKTRILVRQSSTVSSVLAFGGVPWYTRLLYRRLYPHADGIICQSRAMADDLMREVRVRKDRIIVLPIPFEIDINRIPRKQPARHTAKPAGHWCGLGPHLLAAGRLVPEKDFNLLLQALVVVRQRFPHADLVIIGSGHNESGLREECGAHGLEFAVQFAGHLEQPYALYPQASLFVLASRDEGTSSPVLEALARDLPIVATPASVGVIDQLRGQPGTWLAGDTSASALASALIKALEELSPGQRFHRPLQPAS